MRVFLCEKPSQGKDIARVLGVSQRGSGCYSGAGIVVTWCIGHLVEAVPPEGYDERYKRWTLEHLPIIPERWRVEPKAATAAQFKIVKQLVGQASELVIATDADREGEMIAREIIELCSYRGPIQRLWLSALNDASIRKALGALKPSIETLPLYYSALARSRADWLIGMNLSRLFTLLGRQAGYTGVLSVGRVQTPTLKLVVDRDREIASFVSVPFWVVEVALSHAGQSFACGAVLCGGLDAAARMCRRRWTLPATVGSPASYRSYTCRWQRAGGDGRNGASARRSTAAVRPRHAAGGMFQAVGSGCAGDVGHCPGTVRNAQSDDLPAFGFRLSAREHAGRGADRSRQPAQD